jgi:hypothetical protein
MSLVALAALLHIDPPHKPGAGTCYIVGQQYSDKFPEIVMVELSNGTDTPHFQYRFEIMRDLADGWVYYTAEQKNGRLKPLNKVEAVTVNSEQFLRVDSLRESRDYLGEIPEI